MDAEEREKQLLDEAGRLVRSAFDLGGQELLRQVEELFSKEAAQLRAQARGMPLPDSIAAEPADRSRYAAIVGDSPAMLRVFALLDKVAPSPVPVLIQGASGTGKELIAKAIHQNSPRKDKDYVTENCAAIPETLLESELFGYKKGAFTGADRNKQGLFVVADGGTLFLDEIGDMSLNMQKKLLRVLQDGEIRPVGSNEVIHVDVRLLSASNKNLHEMVDKRLFREDLFYRLNTITVELPPLRDRAEDIPALAAHFIDKIAGEMGVEAAPLTEEASEALERYRWPGNIRELENEMRRCLALKGQADAIGLEVLSDDVKNG